MFPFDNVFESPFRGTRTSVLLFDVGDNIFEGAACIIDEVDGCGEINLPVVKLHLNGGECLDDALELLDIWIYVHGLPFVVCHDDNVAIGFVIVERLRSLKCHSLVTEKNVANVVVLG